MFKTPNFSTKEKELQLINGFVQQHDLLCICPKPAVHCLHILTKKLLPELTDQDKNQLIQCLGTTATATEEDHGKDADIGLEDLERLFEEDTTENDTG